MTSRTRKRRHVTTKPLPWNGDHGTGTAAATAGTEFEQATDNPNDTNPNNMGRRVRVNVIQPMIKRGSLTMRQGQAAQAIQQAHCKVEMLSSGGELKEQVQSSPKPDATIDVQVERMGELVFVTRPILRGDRALVEWVCYHNRPVHTFARMTGNSRPLDRFRMAMDRVADQMRY